jgi:acyl-coenzyme A thioesterase PaaI-like protein
LAGCGVLALAGQPAAAKKGKRKAGLGPVVTRSASVTATSINQHVETTATCPKGRKAVNGGFSATVADTANMLIVYRSVRSGQRSWNVAALSNTDVANTLTVTAYCRRIKRRITTGTAIATTPPGDLGTATAAAVCPGRKQKLIGGGFSSDVGVGPDQIALVSASRFERSAVPEQAGTRWIYSATNGTPQSRTLTGYAYCTKGVKRAIIGMLTSQGSVSAFGDLSVVSTGCPKGRRLSGGGFTGTPFTQAALLVVRESLIAGPTWRATSRNFRNSPATGSLTSQGICL